MSSDLIKSNTVYPDTSIRINWDDILDEAISVEATEYADTILNVIVRGRTPLEIRDDHEGRIIFSGQMEYESRGEMLRAIEELEDWAADFVADLTLPKDYERDYLAELDDYIMPDTLCFENGLTLSKMSSAPSFADLNDLKTNALAYKAARLFRGCGYDDTMDDVDQSTFVQQNELYLNNGDGYVDSTSDFIAKTMVINDYGVVYAQCWDVDTGNHSAWYSID